MAAMTPARQAQLRRRHDDPKPADEECEVCEVFAALDETRRELAAMTRDRDRAITELGRVTVRGNALRDAMVEMSALWGTLRSRP